MGLTDGLDPSGSNPFEAMAEAVQLLDAHLLEQPAHRYVEWVDRHLLVLEHGVSPVVDPDPPADLAGILAGTSTSVLRFVPGGGAPLAPVSGVEQVVLPTVDSLGAALTQRAERIATLAHATLRLGLVPDPIQPGAVRVSEWIASKGLVAPQSASVEVVYDDTGFGPGASLLDLADSSSLAQLGSLRDAVSLNASSLIAPGSARVLSVDAGGATRAAIQDATGATLPGEPFTAVLEPAWPAEFADRLPEPVALTSRATLFVFEVLFELRDPGGEARRLAVHRDFTGSSDSVVLPVTAPGNDDRASGIRLDAGGRLLVFGQTGPTGEPPTSGFVWRLGSALEVDPAFGVNGLMLLPGETPGGSATVSDLEILGDTGRIALVGEEERADGAPDLRVALLTGNGQLDLAFAGNGRRYGADAFADPGSAPASRGASLEVDAAGRLCVAGTIADPESGVLLPGLWRLGADGEFDGTLRGDGSNRFGPSSAFPGIGVVGFRPELELSPFAQGVHVADLALLPNGDWLLAGSRFAGEDEDAVWWRFTPEGAPGYAWLGSGWRIEDGSLVGGARERIERIVADGSGGWASFGRSTVGGPGGEQSTEDALSFVDP